MNTPDFNLKSFSFISVPLCGNYNPFYTHSPSFQGTIMFGTVGFPDVCDYSGVFHCFISAGIKYLGLLLSLPLFNMRREAVPMKAREAIKRLKKKKKNIRDIGQTLGLPKSPVWKIIKKKE